ncbi:MAG: 4-hydroxythreonine-4-phosphate dehydrogenase PdxA [Thioalkalivibrionaceae bacterium]
MTLNIALSAGEPAGIGPELLVQLAQLPPLWPWQSSVSAASETWQQSQARTRRDDDEQTRQEPVTSDTQDIGHTIIHEDLQRVRRVALADRRLLQQRAHSLGLALDLIDFEPHAEPPPFAPGRLEIIDHPLAVDSHPGRLDPRNATHVIAMLQTAVDGCLGGRFSAIVTGPLQKSTILDAAIPGMADFRGHTEWLATAAEQYFADRGLNIAPLTPVMLLTREPQEPHQTALRVALATTHLPLRAVPDAITSCGLETVLRVLDDGLRVRFGLAAPRIAVCGLNPHAGEDGRLGDEERLIIAPTIDRLRAQGLNLYGPLPADTAFAQEQLTRFDAYLAMYHDQGLPVLKHAGFGRSVNVTLGLPFVRTSVDHGTALDLAGSGRADVGSLRAAEQLAIRLAATIGSTGQSSDLIQSARRSSHGDPQ